MLNFTIIFKVMLRTVIKPGNRNVFIELPQNYVGKQVEVIAFTIEESTIAKTDVTDDIATHFASEKILGKDWLTIQEDEAWKDL